MKITIIKKKLDCEICFHLFLLINKLINKKIDKQTFN